MNFLGRRSFVALASSLGIGMIASTSSKAFSSSSKGQCLSIEDQRVKQFTAYRKMAFQDPAKALESYTSPDLSYTSTSGQPFNRLQLIKRISQWNKGFRRIAVDPINAMELDDGSILIIYNQNVLNSGDFRGTEASNRKLDLTSIFRVSYDKNGLISEYSSYQDYGHLAKSIGSEDPVQLLELR